MVTKMSKVLTKKVNKDLVVTVVLDKNKQVCEITPRVFNGKDLFSKYKGHPGEQVIDDVVEYIKLWS